MAIFKLGGWRVAQAMWSVLRRLCGGVLYITQPLCGSILQAGTCQILSLAENPRWSRDWQYNPGPQEILATNIVVSENRCQKFVEGAKQKNKIKWMGKHAHMHIFCLGQMSLLILALLVQ